MNLSLLLPKRDRNGERPSSPGEILTLLQLARRIAIFVLGMTVVLIGVIMIVTPGPAFLIIPLGLAILATEFVWARRILDGLRARLKRATVSGGREPPGGA